MKKQLIIILLAFGMIACNGVSEEEHEKVLIEKELLEAEVQERDSSLNEFFSTLNSIETNLAIIKSKENIISEETSYSLEGREDVRERINEDIILIGELMEKNRQLITELNQSLRKSNTRIKELENMVERLTKQLEEKEIEIMVLKDELAKLNFQVDVLTAKVDDLEEEKRLREQHIAEKTNELNTAYYAIGSRKELMENDIISREGGFLGIGRTSVLQPDFDDSYFTKIDIRDAREILIIGDKPKIITSHPSNSYSINEDGDNYYIEINDINKFWSASRYLVVVID
ncbi:MAG: hypothetical protein R6U11_06445 [Bacteroidales bacterium]